jgi:hypothetical protein
VVSADRGGTGRAAAARESTDGLRDRHIAPGRSEQVENYYQSTFLPVYRSRAGGRSEDAAVPALDEVREQILEILVEQETNQRLEQWLAQLRRNARIELRLE